MLQEHLAPGGMIRLPDGSRLRLRSREEVKAYAVEAHAWLSNQLLPDPMWQLAVELLFEGDGGVGARPDHRAVPDKERPYVRQGEEARMGNYPPPPFEP